MRKFLHYHLYLWLLLTIMPFTVSAHTVLETSNPAEGETVTAPLKQIELTFAEDIEPLSVLEVRNKSGEEIAAGKITVSNNVLNGTLESALPNGEYTVTWTIAGKDGHIIEGEFSFAVNVPVEQPMPTGGEEETVQNPPSDTATATPGEPAASEGNSNVIEDQQTKNSSGMFLTVGALIILVVVASLFIRRLRGNDRR